VYGAAGLSTVEERIYAGIATALKAAAASAHTPTKAAATAAATATSSPAARHVGTPGPAVTPLLRQAADYPAAVGVPVGQHPDASCATASTVAAAMQELAAATAADQLGQQLQQQLGQLERDVEVLKKSVAAHLRGEHSCGSLTDANGAHNSDMQQLREEVQKQSQSHEQLQKQQECFQQELGEEAAAQKQQLQHQQELIAVLSAEVQALKQQQQQVMTPSQQEQLDLAIKQQCQQQLAQLSKQQVDADCTALHSMFSATAREFDCGCRARPCCQDPGPLWCWLALLSIGSTMPRNTKRQLLLAGQPAGSEFVWQLPTAMNPPAQPQQQQRRLPLLCCCPCCAGGTHVCVDGGPERGAAGPHGWTAATPAGQQGGGEWAPLGGVQSPCNTKTSEATQQ